MGEVLVIGGGMAGAIAALAARKNDARVVLVRRSLGATAMSSGAVDVAADLAAPPGDLSAQRAPLEDLARKLAHLRPHHPYALLQSQLGRLPESLDFAIDRLRDLLAPAAACNALLPTPLGTVKPTATAQCSQLGADVASLPEHVAVVELANNPAWDARLVARGIESAASTLGRTLRATPVPSQHFRRIEDALRGPYELSEALDSPAALTAFAEDLRRALPSGIQAIVLPPIFGRRALGALQLSELMAVPCFEMLSTAPSVPGLRLQDALDRALDSAGVERVDSELLPRPITEDAFALGSGRVLHPSAVILATGKFIGGGIERAPNFREPIFGLPVYIDGRVVTDQYVGDLLAADIRAEQAVFHAGVRIDPLLRPLDADGNVARTNLFAAGSVISGYDLATDKSGLGVCIFTGYLAGEAAARVGA